ncbi:hypothetical protein B0T16DRAFT_414455 [Cercophora newfieldiana]|uniref:Uncharacterized protein n=1 Tax=Cercophora newfieldiana TaxID=92897 RepID=A0AA39Y6F5_9PEZI|nr:hypothetical protein B0T16DRAFT_414455 [Cercophora newfieldiana]
MSAPASVEDEVPQEFLPAVLRRPGGHGDTSSIFEVPGHVQDTTKQRGGGNRRKAEAAPRRPHQNINSSRQPDGGGNSSNNNNPNDNGNDSDSDSDSENNNFFSSLASQFDGWDRSLNPLHQARMSIVQKTPESRPWTAALDQQAAHNSNSVKAANLLFSSPGPFSPSISISAMNPATKGIAEKFKADCDEITAMDAERDKYIASVVFDEVDKDFYGVVGVDRSAWNASADFDALLREVEMALLKRCRVFDRGSPSCPWTAAELDSPDRVDIRLAQMLQRMVMHLATVSFTGQMHRAQVQLPWLKGQSMSREIKETFRHVVCPVDEETGPGRNRLVSAYFKALLRVVVAATKPTKPASKKLLVETVSQIRRSRSTTGELSNEYKDWLRSLTTDEAIAAAQIEFLERRAKSCRLRLDKRVVSKSSELQYQFLSGVDRPGTATLALIQTSESGSSRLPVAIKEVAPEDLAKMGWVCDVRPDGSVLYWRRGISSACRGGMVRRGIFKLGMHGEVLELLSASPIELPLPRRSK